MGSMIVKWWCDKYAERVSQGIMALDARCPTSVKAQWEPVLRGLFGVVLVLLLPVMITIGIEGVLGVLAGVVGSVNNAPPVALWWAIVMGKNQPSALFVVYVGLFQHGVGACALSCYSVRLMLTSAFWVLGERRFDTQAFAKVIT